MLLQEFENHDTLELEDVQEDFRHLLIEDEFPTALAPPNMEGQYTITADNPENDFILDGDETLEEFTAKLKVMEEREDALLAQAREMAGEEATRRRRQVAEEIEAERLEANFRYREELRRAQQPVEDLTEFVPNMRMISEQNAALIAEVHALLNDEEPTSYRRNHSQINLAELMAELNAIPNDGHGPRMPHGPVFSMSLRDFLFVADDNSSDELEEENARASLPEYLVQGDRADNILFFPDYSIVMNEEEDEEERIATNNFNAALDNFFNMRIAEGRPSVTLGRDLHNFLTFLEDSQ